MKANATLLHRKYGRVIVCFAQLAGISLREEMDFFYHSTERELIRDGVSDLHCMQDIMDNSRDSKEISAAAKRKEKLQKQLKEAKEYDARIAHLALSRIDIDLDDGVKVNYQKVQTTPDGKVMKILAKI